MLVFALLIIQLWVFMGITIILHRLSPRYGLTPLIVYIAGCVAILNYAELFGLFIVPFPGIVLRIGAHVFVPIILLSVLLLYIANGTQIAQLIVFAVMLVNLLVLVTLAFMFTYITVVQNQSTAIYGLIVQEQVITPAFVRGAIASTIVFFVNMLVMAIFYQGVRNTFARLPKSIAIGFALIAALWADSILFNLLTNIGTPTFELWLPGDVVAKSLSGIMIAPFAAYYLVKVAPKLPGFASQDRPTLDILFGAIGSLRSTLHQLRREMTENQITFGQLTENLNAILWLAGVNQDHPDYISPAFERITHQKVDQFLRYPNRLIDILHPDDQLRVGKQGLIAHLLTHPDDVFRIVRPKGEIRWLRSRVLPIRDGQGRIYRYVGIIDDITDRHSAAEHEKALLLEREKVHMLRDFVRDASHDLKSPLSAILLKANLIQNAGDDKSRQKHIYDLQLSANHLSQMIDDLFTLSRLESTRCPELHPVDVTQLAQQIYDTLAPMVDPTSIKFTLNMAPAPLWVYAYPEDLSRLILNLAENALRYTPMGEVTLDIQTADMTTDIIVSDTGIGISAEDLPHIFERFYRSQGARNSGKSGTGLGLSIVKSIVDCHEGEIEVESQISRGTTVKVSLNTASAPNIPEERPHYLT